MNLVPLELGLRSNQARDAAVGSASFVNAYAEPIGSDAKVPNPIYACDGWASFSTLTSGGKNYGMLNVNDTLLWTLSGNFLFSVTSGGTSTVRNFAATAGAAYFARNRASTPDVYMVTSDGTIRYITGTTVSTPSFHVDIGSSLFNSVCMLDGFFIFTKSNGEWFISGLDVATVDALDFAPALGATGSEKDKLTGLVRGLVRGRELVLAGTSGMSFWQNTGQVDFPFQRQHVAPFGTYAGPAMVSVAAVVDDRHTETMIWPATSPDGGFIGVLMLVGYDAKKISTWEVDNAIRTATQGNLRAYSYESQGNTFYAITDSTNWTYEYNCRTGLWHQRKSSGLSFGRPTTACSFAGKTIFGDYTSGLLYQQSTSATPGSASLVSLRTSKNNGTTWTTARTKAVGTSSSRAQRAKFTALGQSREDGFLLEVKITNAIVEGSNSVDMTIVPPAVHASPYPVQLHALHVDFIPGVSGTANQKGAMGLYAAISKVGA